MQTHNKNKKIIKRLFLSKAIRGKTPFPRSTTSKDAYWGNARAIRSTVWQCHPAGPGGQRYVKVPTLTFLLSTASSAWKEKLLLFS